MEIQNADGLGKPRYTYEKRVWGDARSVPVSDRGQATVRDPVSTLGRDEKVRRTSTLYEARFVSEKGRHYSAKVRLNDGSRLRKARITNRAATPSIVSGQSSLRDLQLGETISRTPDLRSPGGDIQSAWRTSPVLLPGRPRRLEQPVRLHPPMNRPPERPPAGLMCGRDPKRRTPNISAAARSS